MKYYEFEILEDRRIIKEKIVGLWTKDIAENYSEDYKIAIKPLLSSEWAKLVNLNDWKTSKPDVIDILANHLVWVRTNKMAYSANIIQNTVARGQLRRMFYEGGTIGFSEVFETEKLALQWLKDKGF